MRSLKTLGQKRIIGYCETILLHLIMMTFKDFPGKYRKSIGCEQNLALLPLRRVAYCKQMTDLMIQSTGHDFNKT